MGNMKLKELEKSLKSILNDIEDIRKKWGNLEVKVLDTSWREMNNRVKSPIIEYGNGRIVVVI